MRKSIAPSESGAGYSVLGAVAARKETGIMYADIYESEKEAWADYSENAARDEWYGQYQIIESFEDFLARRKWESECTLKEEIPFYTFEGEDVPF